MSAMRRGDGVGIEFTCEAVRGVRLGAQHPERLVAAGEVAVSNADDDRSILDALLRLHAELDGPETPCRVALFPMGSTLHRVDATGRNPSELNALRSQLIEARSVASTVLVDDGPRRWLVAVSWDETTVHRVQDLTERAGFLDAAIEPSPLALVRVLHPDVTHVRRDSARGEAFELLVVNGVPLVAGADDALGRQAPAVVMSLDDFSSTWFDDLDHTSDLVAELQRVLAGFSQHQASGDVSALRLSGVTHPAFPEHDRRSPQRQCVALGAALGAAGLAGRLRPVDMVMATVATSDAVERPWAIERVAVLPATPPPNTVGKRRRLFGRRPPES